MLHEIVTPLGCARFDSRHPSPCLFVEMELAFGESTARGVGGSVPNLSAATREFLVSFTSNVVKSICAFRVSNHYNVSLDFLIRTNL